MDLASIQKNNTIILKIIIHVNTEITNGFKILLAS